MAISDISKTVTCIEERTDRQTNKHTDKHTNRQTNILAKVTNTQGENIITLLTRVMISKKNSFYN